jgi:putative Mn2+ efflux pump MntP
MSGIDFPYLLVIAISLSADCFAVALSSSISRKSSSLLQLLRLSLLFGIFQSLMAFLGWLAGRTVVDFISAFDHWVAFGLLLFIGARMIWQSFRGGEEGGFGRNMAGWPVLITLSIATSIDALAVGLSFAFLQVNIAMAVITIGITALVITIIGSLLGKKVGALVGERAETIGGVILIIIGLRILLEHLL